MEQLTKNQAVATSQEDVQNQNEPQLRDENAHNDKSVHGVLNPTYQDERLARLVLRVTKFISKRRISGRALLILGLLQRIFLMSSLMLLLVWLIFFMVLIKLLPILGTISGKTVKLMVLALICLGNNRQD